MNPTNNATSRQADCGDAEQTPFVRFDVGVMYPPNEIYQAAEIVLGQLDRPTSEIFKELVVRGPIGGQYGVLPKSTWFALIHNFLTYQQPAECEIGESQRHCTEALRIMVQRPHEEAWGTLRDFIVRNANELSGWETSFRKRHAEDMNVSRGEDGNYYYNRDSGEKLIRIVGAKTTDETRLDFITNQLVLSTGFLHQFISMFALFAIADDFERNPHQYHRMIKASLPNPSYRSVGASWTFMHFDHARSYRWRPHSNMCDPDWLVGDVLGRLTDTLEIDCWMRRADPTDIDQQWLDDGLNFQVDYALDTALHLSSEPRVYIPFEGRVIHWINGTPERDATASISVADLQNHTNEDATLNRFLTLLVWDHRQAARVKWQVGGGRTAYSKAYSSRRAANMQIDPIYLRPLLARARTDTQRLALALYREAKNSSSTFYEFLSYWRILELAVGHSAKARRSWLESVAIPKLSHDERLEEVLAQNPNLEEYLRESRTNGIKHAINGKIDPDNPRDSLANIKDNHFMEEIARLVMTDKLGL